jgi:hypothetical protein
MQLSERGTATFRPPRLSRPREADRLLADAWIPRYPAGVSAMIPG